MALRRHRLRSVRVAPHLMRLLPAGAGASAPPPFSPASLPDLTVWLKADALTAAGGAPVTAWPDSSGHGHDLTVPGGGTAPALAAGAWNGLPAVRFDGVSNSLAAAFTWTQPATLVAAVAAHAWAAPAGILDGYTIGTLLLQDTSSAGIYRLYCGANGGPQNDVGDTHTAPFLVTAIADGASSSLRFGRSGTTYGGNPGAAAPGGLTLGGFGGGGIFGASDICELAGYGRHLGGDELTLLGDYFGARYGLT